MQPFTCIKNEAGEAKINIVFIGSKITSSFSHEINAFLQQNPTEEEREEYRNALQFLKQNPFFSQEEIMKRSVLKSEKGISNFNAPRLLMELSDEQRIDVLAAVADLGLDLYGTENWARDYFYHANLN